MTDMNLTQSEADALIAMEKYRINEDQCDYPSLGGSISVPLRSEDKREEFFLNAGYQATLGGIDFAEEIVLAMDFYLAGKTDRSFKHFLDRTRRMMKTV